MITAKIICTNSVRMFRYRTETVPEAAKTGLVLKNAKIPAYDKKNSETGLMQYSTNSGSYVSMNDKPNFDQVIQRVLASLPADVAQIKQDIEKNMRAALSAGFSKMDLVTREEYEVQSALLQRTREKLEEMEKQLAELEQQLLKKNTS